MAEDRTHLMSLSEPESYVNQSVKQQTASRNHPGPSSDLTEIAVLRTFVAVKIASTPELRRIRSRLAELGERFRPVALDNLHVTLKFLGDTSQSQVSEICAVARRVGDGVAATHVTLRGLGAFPNVRRPSVVWVGLDQAEVLCRIAADLEQALAPLGFAPENRAFQPHLTLLRIKARPPEELFSLLAQENATDFGVVPIDDMEYLQSELGPRGARYSKLATIALGTRNS
jgi:2'-5' RNA ligase